MYAHNTRSNNKYKKYYTRADIKKIYDDVNIGDQLDIVTVKGTDLDCSCCFSGVKREAIIVGKTPNFIIVKLPSGVIDTINYIDYINMKRIVKKFDKYMSTHRRLSKNNLNKIISIMEDDNENGNEEYNDDDNEDNNCNVSYNGNYVYKNKYNNEYESEVI